jgi:crotonobetainyl-CoA:carnitine CoA-transferase CaiB-like acyl-CoA transferase
MTALTGITVVETAERVCGEWTGRLLADFGAQVIKVERPGGSPTRRYGPHVAGESAVFGYCNTNKMSVVIDLDDDAGRARLAILLARADALIDDHDPKWCRQAGLDPDSVREHYPRLVHCQITPFGQAAPEDHHHAFPINVAAAGGWAWHTPSESDPADPPLMGAGRFMPDYDTGLDAAIATTASLLRQRRTGQGQFIDLSEVGVQLSRADVVLGRVLAGDDEPSHSRRSYDMGGPHDTFACADGFVHLVMLTRAHWQGLRRMMGNPGWTEAFPEDWLEFHCTPERVASFREQFRSWIAGQRRNEVSIAAQALGVPLVPVNTAADLLDNEQYRHRGYFQSLGGMTYPTAAYRMTASPVRLTRAAPALDADRAEVLP